MNKFVLASQNKHKLEEIQAILQNFEIQLESMADVGLKDLEIIEDGQTFEENSMKKAVEVMERTQKVTIADDSGLEVEALNNQPGIYSARFSGEHATDKKNNEKLLHMLKDVPYEKRKARFVCVISVAFPDGRKISVRGECRGYIGNEEVGQHGFGYDPLFIVPEYDQTLAQIGPKIKNKISHRAKALEKLQIRLEEAL